MNFRMLFPCFKSYIACLNAFIGKITRLATDTPSKVQIKIEFLCVLSAYWVSILLPKKEKIPHKKPNIKAYDKTRLPAIIYRHVLEKEVKIKNKFEVDVATFVFIPNSSSSGAINIPPPIPSIPLTTPAIKQKKTIFVIFPSTSGDFMSNSFSINFSCVGSFLIL